jgi:penicillin-binding protein 2
MEEALRRGMEAVGSQSGVAIAMDPMTGEILGMVSLPSYDNNVFARGISADEYKILESNPWRPLMNHAISGQYTPGSTFKIIPAVAVLEEGVVTPRTTVNCEGILLLPNKYFPDKPELAQPFYCWIYKYGTGHGPTNIIAGIALSCDIYFYQVSGGFEDFEGLGLERLTKYARLFGLGERTGIELPGEGERPGLVPSERWKRTNYGESWSTGDTYNIAIGQGFILVTPLQLLNATAAVANGGILYRPRIVHKVISSSGEVIKHFEPEVIRKIPVSEESLEVVKDGMEAAVIWGTAKRAYLEDVTVAAKTGSAEFPGPRDEEGNLPTHAWITAFAPVDEPEIALVVFVYGGKSGAKTAAPIAAEILRYYFDWIAD